MGATTWASWINITVNYCCTRVQLYAKMLKETETEENNSLFCDIFFLVAFQFRASWPPPPPPATPMAGKIRPFFRNFVKILNNGFRN